MSILGGESVWGFFIGVDYRGWKCMMVDRIMTVISGKSIMAILLFEWDGYGWVRLVVLNCACSVGAWLSLGLVPGLDS